MAGSDCGYRHVGGPGRSRSRRGVGEDGRDGRGRAHRVARILEECVMEYRRLGRSGLDVSIVCLGTMMFGDRTGEREAGEIVAHAFGSGINFIDTADVYAKGASETITGAAIRRAARAVDPRDEGRQRNRGRRQPAAAHGRRVAAVAVPGLRCEPRAAWHRLDRHLLPSHRRCEDAARGDRRSDGRADRCRQDPLFRRLQFSWLAHRGTHALVRARSASRRRSSASRITTC